MFRLARQTNVYPSAQRRKMRPFEGFQRRAVVIVPTDEEFQSRSEQREKVEGKEIPDSAILEMKGRIQQAGKDLLQPCLSVIECNWLWPAAFGCYWSAVLAVRWFYSQAVLGSMLNVVLGLVCYVWAHWLYFFFSADPLGFCDSVLAIVTAQCYKSQDKDLPEWK